MRVESKYFFLYLSVLLIQSYSVPGYSETVSAFTVELRLSKAAQMLLNEKKEKVKVWVGYTSQKVTDSRSEPSDLGSQTLEVSPKQIQVRVPKYQVQKVTKSPFGTVELNVSSARISSKENFLHCIDQGAYIDIKSGNVKVDCCLIKNDSDLSLDQNKKFTCKP